MGPRYCPAFERRDECEQADRHYRQEQYGGKNARGLELCRPDLDRMTEAGVRSDELAEHGPDHRDGDRDFRPREQEWEGRRQLQIAKDVTTRRVQCLQHLDLITVD